MAKGSSEYKDLARRFGSNLRRHRQKAQLSQEKVAFLAALNRTEIGLLERGERVPRIDTLIKLAAAISTPPADLLAGIVWELPTRNIGRIKVEPGEGE